jgi:hypothetical protein
MKKLIFIFYLIGLFTTSTLWATGLSGIIIAGGGGSIATVPSAPTGVSATAGNAQNTVTWTASSGSTSCNLYWKSGSSMSGNCTGNGTKVTGVTSPDVIGSLTNGTAYYYMVTCQNSAGESACSAEVNATPTGVTAPGSPTSVAAVAGNTQFTPTWAAPSSGGTPSQYNVWYSTSSNTELSGTEVANTTSGTPVTGLTNGTTYYIKVQSQNSAGTTLSSEVLATPVPVPVQQGGYSGTLTASTIGDVNQGGSGTDFIMQNYPLTASTITEAKIENYRATSTTAWIAFKVWRLSGGIYTLIGDTGHISMQTTSGIQTYTFTGITCQTGDLIGYATNAGGGPSPYGQIDALSGSGNRYYKASSDITSGAITQGSMTLLTTYANVQIQFFGN